MWKISAMEMELMDSPDLAEPVRRMP
jgi:hypothetical protein